MSNKFLVFGGIDADMASDFCEWIYEMEDQLPTTLRVYINSPGGSLYALRAMVDAMQTSSHTIITFGTGHIMSAGHMLFIAGDHRILFNNCKCMTHQHTSGAYGKHHELETQGEENKKIFNEMVEFYAENSVLTPKQVEKRLLHQTDVYLSAKEMLECGLTDEICIPGRAVDIKKKRKAMANV